MESLSIALDRSLRLVPHLHLRLNLGVLLRQKFIDGSLGGTQSSQHFLLRYLIDIYTRYRESVLPTHSIYIYSSTHLDTLHHLIYPFFLRLGILSDIPYTPSHHMPNETKLDTPRHTDMCIPIFLRIFLMRSSCVSHTSFTMTICSFRRDRSSS